MSKRERGRRTLALCGDVMTGRGIDQILPHPGDPRLYEPWVHDASRYVGLAEARHGAVPAPVAFDYPWGDALAELDRAAPDLRIVNLETAITRGGTPWPSKGIHYRMHPENLPCLTAARIDACTLANNHVLDWDEEGLLETLRGLEAAGIAVAGAGADEDQATAPCRLDVRGGGRVLLVGLGDGSSGILPEWAAGPSRPGVWRLPDLSEDTAGRVADAVRAARQDGDVVVVSIHWGGNWGYGIPDEQRGFAHALIDAGVADVVHGHSSHHPKGIEVHRGRLILYGCGDFLNDYEGIRGEESFRPDLALLYFAAVDPANGGLLELRMEPFRMRRLRLKRAPPPDVGFLAHVLTREGRPFGTRVETADDTALALRW